ncbi:hypothetical protein AB0J74_32875 [Asanoa sp. NPDC049573]|uniref:hypothetical protein n=1 Tax=Asanoa sp. NPDC049573 TaxID=3155396 RepID=UPI0034181BB5
MGAASGGKTTYLGTLSFAVERLAAEKRRRGSGVRPWQMTAANDASRDFVTLLRQEIRNHSFPQATVATANLSWHVQGSETSRTKALLPWKRTWVTREIDFYLDVADLPGEAFLLQSDDARAHAAAVERMVQADALVILFDPMLELNRAGGTLTNHDYIDKFVHWMLTKAEQSGRLTREGTLPQHVALCVTKFDEPTIFEGAYHAGFVSVREDGSPRIPNELIDDYYDWIDQRIRTEVGRASATEVRSLLETTFAHVSCYAVSSIGFHRDERERFWPGDPGNVRVVDEERQIRGSVYPVNVLEPLIDLERRIKAVAE